jgi:hypothetical protein
MEVIVASESGYDEAAYGMSLSFKDEKETYERWWTKERKERMYNVLLANCKREGGHNKFLESMVVHLDVKAPRYWWSEMDTYRVGTTKQSGSTMHTLQNRGLTIEDFEYTEETRYIIESFLLSINMARTTLSIQELKQLLPESYLQRRLICTNYKVLRNIKSQRKKHRLPEWQYFLKEVELQVKYPEFLG